MHREHVESLDQLNEIESQIGSKQNPELSEHPKHEHHEHIPGHGSHSLTKVEPIPEIKPLSKPTTEDLKFYQEALNQARKGYSEGGIPVGAVLVHKGEVIGRGYNKRIQLGSVMRHGEMDCFENCGRQKADVYRECTMYTTLSPCSMCNGAIRLFGIQRVVIGENVNFKGDEELIRSRGAEVILLNDKESIEMMKSFINKNKDIWCEDIGICHL